MASKSLKAKPNTNSVPTLNKSNDFLLAEFKDSADAWRFADARIESVIKFYLSVFATAAPVVAVLYNYLSDFRIFMGITIIIDCCLVGMGYVAIQSVTHSDIRIARHQFSMQLIRRYFADRDPKILPYLYFTAVDPIVDGKSDSQIRPFFSKILVIGINLVNSILIGWIISGAIWLVLTWLVLAISFTQSFLIGFVVTLVCFAVFQLSYSRKINKFGNTRKEYDSKTNAT